MEEKLRLAEFVSANPYMPEDGWRQELIRGEVRTLGMPPAEVMMRSMALGSAFAACVRRAKLQARIETGTGIGVEDPEGDDYRIAHLTVALPDSRGRRHEPAVACLVVPDADSPDSETLDRLAVFARRASLRDLLLFSAMAPVCRARRRLGDGWTEDQRAEGLEASVRLASIPASVFLAPAYADLDDGS